MPYFSNTMENTNNVALFNYSAENSNNIAKYNYNNIYNPNSYLIKQHLNKNCNKYRYHLQYYNTMPKVESINNVPKIYLRLEEN